MDIVASLRLHLEFFLNWSLKITVIHFSDTRGKPKCFNNPLKIKLAALNTKLRNKKKSLAWYRKYRSYLLYVKMPKRLFIYSTTLDFFIGSLHAVRLHAVPSGCFLGDAMSLAAFTVVMHLQQ